MPERGIEPIELDATKADWTVTIASRSNDFDEFRTKVEVTNTLIVGDRF